MKQPKSTKTTVNNNFCTFIIIIILLLTTSTTFVNSQKKSLPELHGATLMNAGLDFRHGGQVPEENGRLPIFKYSYGSKTFTPAARPDLKFKVPDEVQVRRDQNHTESYKSDVFQSYYEAMSYSVSMFSFSIGISFGFFGFGLGFSRESGRITFNLRSEYKGCMQGLYFTSTYNVIGLPYMFKPQNDMFVMFVNRLPAAPQTARDLEQYKLFLQYFGGFFLWRGVFGGQIKTYGYVNEKIIENHEERWRNTQFRFSFHFKLFSISAGYWRRRHDIRIDKEYWANSNTEIYFSGGYRHLQTNETLKEWDRSIDDSPGLLYGDFRPLSHLLKNQEIKKKNMEWIIKHYSETGEIKAPPAALLVNGKRKIPGHQLIGSGFDVAHMQSRMSIFDHETDGFSKSTSWANPLTKSNSFAVPSTVYVKENVENCESSYSSVATTYDEFQEEFSKKLTGEFKLGYAKRTSETWEYLKNQLVGNVRVTSEKQVSYYDLALDASVYFDEKKFDKYLNPYFKEFLKHSTTDRSDRKNMLLYRKLITFFGTHMIIGAKMGGRLEKEVFIKKSVLKDHSINQLKSQCMKTLMNQNVEDWFSKNSNTKTTFYGTSAHEVADKLQVNNVLEKAKSEPGVLKYEIVPISVLIKDVEKKKLLNEEIDNYLREMNQIPQPKSGPSETNKKVKKTKEEDEKYWNDFISNLGK